jgi:hypothetical protein
MEYTMKRTISFALATLLAACGGADGELVVLADVDSVIAEGLSPGPGPADVADGWSFSFTRYAVHFGDVVVGKQASTEGDRQLDVRRVIDLAQIPGQTSLGSIDGLAPGRWDALSYSVSSATGESECDVSAGSRDDPESLCRELIDEGLGVMMEGVIENPEGRSCPPDGTPDRDDSCVPATRVEFRFEFPVDARFVECRTESGLGVGIPSGGRTSVALSYHSEHLLFNALGEGARTIVLRAQFIANADLDGDGRVTTEELASIPRAAFDELFVNGTDLESFSASYSLSGALLPIDTAADYVQAHLMTQGHLNGEQECEPEIL